VRRLASGRLSEPHRETDRRNPLKPKSVNLAALAGLKLEPDVYDAVGPVFLGLAPQGLDSRLTIGFGVGIARGPPGPRGPDSPYRNCTPAVVEGGRKTHSHEVQSVS
jgi:hypothetical protein